MDAVNERPILMSAPMVRAILDGRKTQTRRVFAPERITIEPHPKVGDYYRTYAKRDGAIVHTGSGPFIPNNWLHYCPYGKPGDRIWVRETWATYGMEAHEEMARPKFYKADERSTPGWILPPEFRWRPSIHMPRWASRITLEITDVRVQRLQDISEADALAEGCTTEPVPAPDTLSDPVQRAMAAAMEGGMFTAKLDYTMLWDNIHGIGAWGLNPWVWAVSFRRLEAC